MDDAALRELERRFEASGAPDDGAQLLHARLRSGALAHEPVELAADLGDASARTALGRSARDEDPVEPWRASVRAALARRLLWRAAAPLAAPRLFSFQGPPNPGRPGRPALPAAAALRRLVEGHDPWEVRVAFGGTETALVLRASRASFRDLGEMWAELALPHPVIGNVPPRETVADMARRYLGVVEAELDPEPARVEATFDLEAWIGPTLRLREVWPGPPPTRALALVRDEYESHVVAETDRDLFVHFWQSLA